MGVPLQPSKQNILAFIGMKGECVSGKSLGQYLSAIAYWCKTKHWETSWNREEAVRAAVKGVDKAGSVRTRPERMPITEQIIGALGKYVNWKNKKERMLFLAGWMAVRAGLRLGEFLPKKEGQPSPTTVTRLRFAKIGTLKLGVIRKSRERSAITWSELPYDTNESTAPQNQARGFRELMGELWTFSKQRNPTDALMMIGPSTAMKVKDLVSFYTRIVAEARRQGVKLHRGKVSGHSFRRGMAHTLAEDGAPVEVIKAGGDWSSEAYQKYINQSTSWKKQAQDRMERIEQSQRAGRKGNSGTKPNVSGGRR